MEEDYDQKTAFGSAKTTNQTACPLLMEAFTRQAWMGSGRLETTGPVGACRSWYQIMGIHDVVG